jgi:inner membrane protein
MYTRWITRKWRITAAITGTLVVLYLFLFVVLQLEDYALLMGSVGLFTALSLVMYLTRRIDWFAAATPGEAAGDSDCPPEHCAG